MTPERMEQIRAALAAWDAAGEDGPVDPAAVLWADGGGQAVEDLRELLGAHDGLRSRVLGLAEALDAAPAGRMYAGPALARRVRELL